MAEFNPAALNYTPPDIAGHFQRGFEFVQSAKDKHLQNRILEMKLENSKEAQEFMESLAASQHPAMPTGADQGANPPPAPPGMGGGVPGQAPQATNWLKLMQDPRVQANPELAERVNNMVSAQTNAQNAEMNQIKTGIEKEKWQREGALWKDLQQSIATSGRSDTAQLMKLSESRTPEAQTLIAEAIENPTKSLAEIRSGMQKLKTGGIAEQAIVDIMAHNPELTREQATMQYHKAQASTRAKGALEAGREIALDAIGPEGLRVTAAQSLFMGKEPSSRSPIYNDVKKEEAKMLAEIGKRKGITMTPVDKASIRSQVQSLYGALQHQQKWASSTQNLLYSLDGMMPEVMKAYNELPSTLKAKPLREIQLYAARNLKGSEAAGRFAALAFEAAGEYNKVILGGVMGGGGAPGSESEREVIQGQVDPALPANTLLGTLNGFRKGGAARMKGHHLIQKDILKSLDNITGGHGAELTEAVPHPPSILPYLTREQASALSLEDLQAMQTAPQE